MTVGELSAVFATLPVKLRCFYKDHELDYGYADMEVLDVVDCAIQRECREDIYGIGIMTYHNILVLDVLIGDKKRKMKSNEEYFSIVIENDTMSDID